MTNISIHGCLGVLVRTMTVVGVLSCLTGCEEKREAPHSSLDAAKSTAWAGKPAASASASSSPAWAPPVRKDGPFPASAAVLDPNGRFATTYRPGGGHLSAFDAAVARGIIPASERELVSDVGSGYVNAFELPRGRAMGLKADLERDKLAPSGGPFHLRLSLKSTAVAPTERPHLSVHLVLDVSGSMEGPSIVNARAAAAALVERLAPTDDFSLVTFSQDAWVTVPDGPVGARRPQIHRQIDSIVAGGGTNIGRGLELGYAQAANSTIPEDALRVVLLLSDGRANSGVTDPARLSALALGAFQKGVQTSAFGLGSDYDGALMSAIAAEGAGGYYYLRDAEQIAPALSNELTKRLDPVATAVELRVRLQGETSLLHVYGSQRLSEEESLHARAQEVAADRQAAQRDGIARDRTLDTQGGMRFFMPAFARDDAHALLFKLSVPSGTGSRSLALVELKYKDRVSKRNVVEEFPVTLTFADSDAGSVATQNPGVIRAIQAFAAGETLSEAATLLGRGDRQVALARILEREELLRRAAETLSEPLFLKDAERLARLRASGGAGGRIGDPLVFAMMLETAGRSYLR